MHAAGQSVERLKSSIWINRIWSLSKLSSKGTFARAQRRQFEEWARSFMMAASRFPGLQGSSVFNFSSTGDYFLPRRFASQPHLENCKSAPEVLALCKSVDSIPLLPTGSRSRRDSKPGFPCPADQ